jgi:heme A synthase
MGALRTIFRYWLWVLLAMVVLQIAFAGYGAFEAASKTDSGGTLDEDSFNNGFEPHITLGYLLVLAGLITLLLALAARAGRPRVMHALVVFVLLIVQVLLAWFAFGVPAVFGALHPLNAFLILGAVAALAVREWRGEKVSSPAAEPAAAPPAATTT